MTRRLHAIIVGRVQGVGFREYVRHAASAYRVTGYVRNGDDGRSVEVVAEGEETALDELLRSLYEGPRFSRVESIAFNWSEASGGFSRFGVEM